LARTVLRRIETQLDRRRDAFGNRRGDHYTLDLRCEKDTPDKAPARRTVRVSEQPGALDPDNTSSGNIIFTSTPQETSLPTGSSYMIQFPARGDDYITPIGVDATPAI